MENREVTTTKKKQRMFATRTRVMMIIFFYHNGFIYQYVEPIGHIVTAAYYQDTL